jgi:hypothetical protein
LIHDASGAKLLDFILHTCESTPCTAYVVLPSMPARFCIVRSCGKL